MAITPLPILDRTAPGFRASLDALFLTQLPAFCDETNETAAGITAAVAGGALTIPYTFSTTTTDADPGAGMLRLSNATQNASTVIRLDLTGADGSTWTSVIDTFDDSTSTVKGHILLQKVGDSTKWMLFVVTALASPSGYKNLTVTNVSASEASPFADGDSLVLKFSRNGDKGDAGAITSNTEFTPYTLPALDIDCSLGNNYFKKTITTGVNTFTFSNMPAGFSGTLEVTVTGGSVAFNSSVVKFSDDVIPSMSAGKTQIFPFVTSTAGTRVFMNLSRNFTS